MSCPPELTAILREHLDTYGTDAEGRLFQGMKGGEVPVVTWNRVWQAARIVALTKQAAATPLAKRPYDLRHAAVSTWLNGGVPATQVAEWAGHSVEVLFEVYAKCLDGSPCGSCSRSSGTGTISGRVDPISIAFVAATGWTFAFDGIREWLYSRPLLLDALKSLGVSLPTWGVLGMWLEKHDPSSRDELAQP